MSALAEVLEQHVPQEVKLVRGLYWQRNCGCGASLAWARPGLGPKIWAKHVEDEYGKALLKRHLENAKGSSDG